MTLLFIILSCANSRAQTFDLALTPANKNTPEIVYSEIHAYHEDSAKEALIVQSLVGAQIEIETNPMYRNSPDLQRVRFQEVYDNAWATVRGNAYQIDGVKRIGEKLITGLSTFASFANPELGPIVKVSEYVSKEFVHYGADMMLKLGETPRLQYELVVGSNAYGLRQAQGSSLAAEFYRKNALAFHQDLNINQPLVMSPKVFGELLRRKTAQQIEKILATLDMNKAEADALRKDVRAVDQKVGGLIKFTNAHFGIIIGRMHAAAAEQKQNDDVARTRDEAIRLAQEESAKLEVARVEMLSTLGFIGGLMTLTDNAEASQFVDRVAQLADAAYRAFNPAPGALPMTLINPYMTALNVGIALFAGPNQDPNRTIFRMLAETLKQLRELRAQIEELGQHLERKLDEIDFVLKKHVLESVRAFGQLTASATITEQQLLEVRNLLHATQRQSYATQLFVSSDKWIDLTHRCSSRGQGSSRLTAEEFVRCRDEIASWAFTSQVETGDDRSLPPEALIEDLGKLLRRDINIYPWRDLRIPQPQAWLSATAMLVRLAREYPDRAQMLSQDVYVPGLRINLERLIEAGAYYQQIMRNLAVKDGRTFRRSLVDRVIANYENAIRSVLNLIEAMPQRLVPGLPDFSRSDVPLLHGDATYESVLREPVGFCTPEGRIEWTSVLDLWRSSAQSAEAKANVNDEFLKHPRDLRWPDSLAELVPLPPEVARVMASDLSKDDRMGLKVHACLSRVKVYDWEKFLTDQIESQLDLEILVWAQYRDTQRRDKTFEIAKIVSHHQANGYAEGMIGRSYVMSIPGKNPMAPAWNGTNSFTYPHSIRATLKDHARVTFLPIEGFKADLHRALDRVAAEANERIAEEMSPFEKKSRLAVDELSLILERGLTPDQPSVTNLLQFVAQPANLPTAETWVTAFSQGESTPKLLEILERRLDILRALIAEVERSSDVKPGRDPFGTRIEELRALRGNSRTHP